MKLGYMKSKHEKYGHIFQVLISYNLKLLEIEFALLRKLKF